LKEQLLLGKLALGCTVALFLSDSALSNAAELKGDTLRAWDEYMQTANSRMQNRLRAGGRFLWIDEVADRARRVQAGEVLVGSGGEPNPKPVPSGLIHHWIGAAFFPDATLKDTLAVVRDYNQYSKFYRPVVVDSALLAQTGPEYRFSIVMRNKALFSKAAFHCEFVDSYFQLDSNRWYSVSYSTSVREIDQYRQASERESPPDQSGAYVWRLYKVSRFENRDGGVYVEMEVIALSRDISPSLRWLVDPIVRRVSRGALLNTLLRTQKAVLSSIEIASSAASSVTSRTSGAHPFESREVRRPLSTKRTLEGGAEAKFNESHAPGRNLTLD
jgi:hypothetical protein